MSFSGERPVRKKAVELFDLKNNRFYVADGHNKKCKLSADGVHIKQDKISDAFFQYSRAGQLC
jgi:hypothetical protein